MSADIQSPKDTTKHPATYSKSILTELEKIIKKYEIERCLDPFGGVGKIHDLGINSLAVEIEPEWAALSEKRGPTAQGDFLKVSKDLAVRGVSFDAVITSPTYGNRMADYFNASKPRGRNTYGFYLGRRPSEGSSASMQWGDAYRGFHHVAWQRAADLIRDGGYFILNIKDHVRNWEVVPVSEWHSKTIQGLGFQYIHRIDILTKGIPYGQNSKLRTDAEYIMIFKKGA